MVKVWYVYGGGDDDDGDSTGTNFGTRALVKNKMQNLYSCVDDVRNIGGCSCNRINSDTNNM